MSLDEASLIMILTEPKNALTKQYSRLFEMEGVEVEFTKDALDLVAKQAIKRKSGARGLRSILEHALLDLMYDLPSLENVQKVVIDTNVIENHGEPLYIYNDEDKSEAS